MIAHIVLAGTLSLLTGLLQGGEPPADCGGAPFRREEVFAFAQEPAVRKTEAGHYEVRFASKGRCDVTVGVCDSNGKVVRHLASGVLGPNAPEPFKRDSLSQALIWDGKDNFGRKVESPETCRVRVSLGLKPVVDKVLMWHPNRFEGVITGIVCDKDGVYVRGGARQTHYSADRVAKFDHEGAYVSTLFPFPKEKMVPGTVVAIGEHGSATVTPPSQGKGASGFRPEPSAFCVSHQVLTMVPVRFNAAELALFRMGTDGSMPPGGHFIKTAVKRAKPPQGYQSPCWLAASPDNAWLYYSGTGFDEDGSLLRWKPSAKTFDHAVYRIAANQDGKPVEPFLGQKDPGNDEKHLDVPMGLAVDKAGNIYVADNGNNRIQVFGADARLLRSIPVPAPRFVAVHPTTRAVYALSYPRQAGQYKILKFLDKTEPVAEQGFPVPDKDRVWPSFCLDAFAAEPTVWVTDPAFHIQLWVDKGGKFELKRDLSVDMNKDHAANIPERSLNSWQPIADPCRPYVYLGSTWTNRPRKGPDGMGLRIDAESGRVEKARVPWVPCLDGLGYSLVDDRIASPYGAMPQANPQRFDPETGKAVPFEAKDAGQCKKAWRLAVSPHGEMFIEYDDPAEGGPASYPGRISKLAGLVAKFDAKGSLLSKDFMPGLPSRITGMHVDLKGNLYVGLPFSKIVNGKELSGFSIAKFQAQGAKLVYSDAPQLSEPLKDKPPRPADFKYHFVRNYAAVHSDVWAENLLWSYSGTLPARNEGCVCYQIWFGLDAYARSFVPEGARHTVSVIDSNGNFILRMGGYGNCDDCGPEVRLSFARFVSAGEGSLYIDDEHNWRMLKVALKYEQERELKLTP